VSLLRTSRFLKITWGAVFFETRGASIYESETSTVQFFSSSLFFSLTVSFGVVLLFCVFSEERHRPFPLRLSLNLSSIVLPPPEIPEFPKGIP